MCNILLQVSNAPRPISCKRPLPSRKVQPTLTSKCRASSSRCATSSQTTDSPCCPNGAITRPTADSSISSDVALPVQKLQISNCTDVPVATGCLGVERSVDDLSCSLSTTPEKHVENTPRKQRLMAKIKRLQSSRWKLRRRVQFTKAKHCKQKSTLKLSTKDEIVEAAGRYLTPLQKSLLRAQLTNSGKQKKGLRWSVQDKLFSLQVHYKSPATYQLVSRSLGLPGVGTLRKIVSSAVGHIDEGFSSVMFRLLQLRVKNLSLRDRQCSLVFDEMAVKCYLSYNKHQDKVVGLTDDGKMANEALVFMIRGLSMKWKQAVGYFFTHDTVATSKLADLVQKCVRLAENVGLNVRCVVCDQGATNVSAMKQLGFTVEAPKIRIDGLQRDIHVIFDVPHLMKSVRNNLQSHDISIGEKIISWKHIDAFYRIDKGHPIRLAPRLTDKHFDMSRAFKMKVRPAVQVMSHSVAAGMSIRIVTKELPPEAASTAEFIQQMDCLFDMLNSRKLNADKEARCAVTHDSDITARLTEINSWISTWKFVGARSQTGIKSHWGLQTSVKSIVALTGELLNEDFIFVCTSRFNQDCIENFFASLRSKQGWSENPTCEQFASSFRNAIVLSSLDSSTGGKNCIDDTDFMLIKHADFVASLNETDENVDQSLWQAPSKNVELLQNDIGDLICEEETIEIYTEAEESLISYLSGWLAVKSGICRNCQEVLTKPAAEHSYCRRPVDLVAEKKRYTQSASVGLVEPCDELITAVHKMEEQFRFNYEKLLSSPQIAKSIFDITYSACDFEFLFQRHAEHAVYLSQKLTKLYIVMRIFYALKFKNRDIVRSGKPKTSASVKKAEDGRKMQKLLHL